MSSLSHPESRNVQRQNASFSFRWVRLASAAVLASVSLVASAQAGTVQVASVAEAEIALPDAPQPALATPVHYHFAGAAQDRPHTDEELTLRKLPLRFLSDEYHIFTSPVRVKKADLKWILPLAGASAAAFATDTHTMRDVVSRDPGFNNANGTASDALRYVAVGVPVALFGVGHIAGDEKSREAGMLGGEAIIDAYVFDEIIKYATLRERPAKDNARGRFFVGDASSDPSFISGHSIVAWSSAAALAGEYNKPWQQGLIYTLASGVSLTRVLGQQHFPSDALLGSAAGWLIGHYVYRAHHRHTK